MHRVAAEYQLVQTLPPDLTRGSRPVVVISRDAINEFSPVVSAAPCTTYREGRRIYPSQVLVKAPEGGLDADSVVLGEQVRVLDKEAAAAPAWGVDGRDNGATQ
jgi:mRNA-degrading endonuclease toxin of MazEF toxin-antitoxin module